MELVSEELRTKLRCITHFRLNNMRHSWNFESKSQMAAGHPDANMGACMAAAAGLVEIDKL